MEIDWPALRALATQTAGQAYAPYSKLQVGAAAQVGDGRVIVGCNVENASFGLTLCAECGLASALHASGGGTLTAVAVRTPDGNVLLPCGRCRWTACCRPRSPAPTCPRERDGARRSRPHPRQARRRHPVRR